MIKQEHRKRSSTASKRRRSSERKSSKDRHEVETIPEETSCQEASTLALLEVQQPKINYQDELVLIFFNSMLDNIVQEWITIPSKIPSICVCQEGKSEEIICKDFKDLAQDDFHNLEVTNVTGSTVSLSKRRRSKRRSSSGTRTHHSKEHDGRDSRKKGGRSRSNDKSETLSKMSIKRVSKSSSSKIERKSRTSSCSDKRLLPSNGSIEWILNPPDENAYIKFRNGNCYEGPVSKKQMHGLGKFIWADGAVYEGEFVHGEATGKGTLEYPDLSVYNGTFCKSLLHGEGVMNITSTSMIYSGNWKAGEKHGHGWLLYEAGDWYEGEWHEDKRHGVGLRHYSTGERYQGHWYQGLRHGTGTFVWTNNDLYKGQWYHGIRHGYGEYTWNAFLNETFTFPLENIYQGNWKEGKRQGIGIMEFGAKSGAKLAGMWVEDRKHGAGVVICGNGTTIESNPLFWDDKPIHLDFAASPGYPMTTPSQLNHVPSPSMEDIKSSISSKSLLELIYEQVEAKCSNEKLESQIIDNMEKNLSTTAAGLIKERPKFPEFEPQCSPLHIAIHMAPEQIDFSYYTNLAVQKYTAQLYISSSCQRIEDINVSGGIKTGEGHPSTVSKYSKWNLGASNELSKSHKVPDQPPENAMILFSDDMGSRLSTLQTMQTEVEEKHLRNTIAANLSRLYQIYDKYATIASPHELDFKPILIRLFLWQMFRDLGIMGRQYSLIDLDLILMENLGGSFESDHYPFERVYFWQFLQILINLAWLMHAPSDITDECKRFGVLATISSKFFDEVVFKSTITSACSLFEYRNLLPINSVYLLYRSIGEPHTARKFLCSMCTKKRENPPCYLKIFSDEKTPKLANGINAVAAGGNLIFLPDHPPDIGQMPDDPGPDPPLDDPFRKELYAFRSLGAKKVVQCLTAVCPQIKCDGVISNMEYPLVFIEFYEVLLMCAFMVVDKVMGRAERIRLRKEKRIRKELILKEEASKLEKSTKENKKSKKK